MTNAVPVILLGKPMTRLQEAFALVDVLIYMVRWKARGHEQNHDPNFCRHRYKVWAWRMADGCAGRVCGWCHLVESWSPTNLPDVEEVVRTRYNGEPDLEWSPPGASGITWEAVFVRLFSESEVGKHLVTG